MAKPQNMNPTQKKIANALATNIKQLMKESDIQSNAECMRKIKEKTNYIFCQSVFSDIINENRLPTTSQLIALADFFEVSTDLLLGRYEQTEKMNLYEICLSISRMFISDLDFEYTTIEREEGDYDNYSGTYRPILATYNALFFSNKRINDFLTNLIDINKMKDIISDELYNKIVCDWLLEIKKDDTNELPEIVSNSIGDPLPF